MRALLFVSLSSIVLAACSTTQENPIYQQSTTYQSGSPATQQYASAPVTQAAQTTLYVQDTQPNVATYAGFESTTPYPVIAHPAPLAAPVINETVAAAAPTDAPTDSVYGLSQVSGTPGYMAMQDQNDPVTTVSLAVSNPPYSTPSPLGAAGTPIDYDYSRNLVTADALTTGSHHEETVRYLQGSGQNYIVQPGDTVYNLSRKTCVGVDVIQSLNDIGADYGIKIGQSLTLPASVC
jgi:LysM repeat protein